MKVPCKNWFANERCRQGERNTQRRPPPGSWRANISSCPVHWFSHPGRHSAITSPFGEILHSLTLAFPRLTLSRLTIDVCVTQERRRMCQLVVGAGGRAESLETRGWDAVGRRWSCAHRNRRSPLRRNRLIRAPTGSSGPSLVCRTRQIVKPSGVIVVSFGKAKECQISEEGSNAPWLVT